MRLSETDKTVDNVDNVGGVDGMDNGALQEYQIPPPPYVLNLDDFSACILSHLDLDLPGLAKTCEAAYLKSPFHLAELWGRIQGMHTLPIEKHYGFQHPMHTQESIHGMFLFFVAQVEAYMKIKIPKRLALDGWRLYERWAYLNAIKGGAGGTESADETGGAGGSERGSSHRYLLATRVKL
jgi:hypothetical protein